MFASSPPAGLTKPRPVWTAVADNWPDVVITGGAIQGMSVIEVPCRKCGAVESIETTAQSATFVKLMVELVAKAHRCLAGS